MPKKVKIVNHDGLVTTDGVEINDSTEWRKIFKQFYSEKYFNKFLNKYEFEGLSYQQVAYIMRQFWSIGTIGCFVREDWDVIKNSPDYDEYDRLVFAPWVVAGLFNIYNYPYEIRFVNTRAVSFIPTHAFKLDKTATYGYIMKNRKGILSILLPKINQIVDVEMTIRVCLQTQKMPFFIACSPEDEKKMKVILNKILSDDFAVFGGVQDLKNIKAIINGAPYIIDKLYNYRQALENEALTLLGINNIGSLQKKEHLTTGEVEENDEQIASSDDEFLSCIEEFFERTNEVLGSNLKVKAKEFNIEQEVKMDYNECEEDNENA